MAEKVEGATFRADFDAYWAAYDHAPETCFKFVQRGLPDIEHAARACRHRRVVIQAGAHAGFWPRRLSELFRKVYAFECEPVLFRCAQANLKRWRVGNVDLRSDALGAVAGTAMMVPHRSAGSWSIGAAGTVPVTMTTIDTLALNACDAIYLDIEGHEMRALIGGLKTIKRFRPMIHVEQLPEYADGLKAYLDRLGYVCVAEIHKDAVYKPKER